MWRFEARGFQLVMGVPLYRWMVFVREIHNLKWMKMDDEVAGYPMGPRKPPILCSFCDRSFV